MNTARIQQAVRDIEKNKTALAWLEQYGSQLRGRDRDGFSITVHLNFAGSCDGAREAREVLASFAELSIEDLVKQAIQNCRNTIDIATSSIREEVSA